MKTLIKTLLCIIGLSLVPLALSAADKQTSLPEVRLQDYEIPANLPEPKHQPIPVVKARYVGMELKLRFTVNQKGEPENVRLVNPLTSYSDVHKMTFAGQMRDLVANWTFEPALNANDQPIAVKVILPVHVIKKGGTPTAVATLILDTGNKG